MMLILQNRKNRYGTCFQAVCAVVIMAVFFIGNIHPVQAQCTIPNTSFESGTVGSPPTSYDTCFQNTCSVGPRINSLTVETAGGAASGSQYARFHIGETCVFGGTVAFPVDNNHIYTLDFQARWNGAATGAWFGIAGFNSVCNPAGFSFFTNTGNRVTVTAASWSSYQSCFIPDGSYSRIAIGARKAIPGGLGDLDIDAMSIACYDRVGATIPGPVTICYPTTTASATATGSGGSGSYTYLWSNGQTAATATSLTTGTYTVTISDATLCDSKTATVSVTVNPQITATTSRTNVSCFGGSNGTATVTAGGGSGSGYTYVWSPSGGTSVSATGLTASTSGTTYTVTVTDGNSCTQTATASLTQPSAVTAAINTSVNVACNGGSTGSATVTAGGGTGSYTYAWSPSGGTSVSATGLTASTSGTTYTVTVTDGNNCSATATSTITQPSAIDLTNSTTNATCGASNGTATVTATGGVGGFTYAWTGSASTTATATALSAGSYTVTVTDVSSCTKSLTIGVSNSGAPTATVTNIVNVLCNGGNNGSASVSVTGGVSPYSYTWSGSASTTATATGLSAGTYVVAVEDQNNCVHAPSFTVTEPAIVTAVVSVTPVLCNGGNTGTATVTAGGGVGSFTYTWTGSASTSAAAVSLTAGTYTVTVTDANNCTKTATAVITEPSPVTATASGTPVLCSGGSTGTATVIAGGGTGSYTYTWTGSASTTATASNLSAGNYTVTVRDGNNCSVTATTAITEPSVVTAVVNATPVLCNNGMTGTATVVPGGGTGSYTYTWSGSASTTATASNLSAGNYTVTVRDGNNCSATATAVITEPSAVTAVVNTTPVLCNSGTTGTATVVPGGGAGSFTYTWAGLATTNATASGLSAGTYTVTVTDGNACSQTATGLVTEPSALIVDGTSASDVLCYGDATGSATVSTSGGTPSFTYSWTGSASTTATAGGASAGVYTVTVQDANLCTITATIAVGEPSDLTLSLSAKTNATCGNSTGTATVSAAGGTLSYTYSWSGSVNTSTSASGLSAGVYTVTVTDGNGCTKTLGIGINNAGAPVLNITDSVGVLCYGNATGSATVAIVSGGSAPFTYSWNTTPPQTNPTATGLTAGTHIVTVTDSAGCISNASVLITQPSAAITASLVSSNPVSCIGSNDGSATVTVTGGTPGYTYLWSGTAGTAATATGLGGGSYTVSVTDANNCVDTSLVVPINESTTMLDASAVNTVPVSCTGSGDGMATVIPSGGTAPYNYSWTGSASATATALGLSGGTYTVTVTDAYNCVKTAAFTISESTTLLDASTVNMTPVSCIGSGDGTATVIPSGGTAPYNYNWTGSASATDTALGLAGGTYTVTVTDAYNCVKTAVFTISESTATLIVSTTSSTPVSCTGALDGSASVTPSGGTAPYNYLWSDGSAQTTAVATTLSGGSYTVTVTDVNGCSTTTAVVVNESPAMLDASTINNIPVTCTGNGDGIAIVTPSGGTAPYSYLWSDAGAQTTASATILAGGVYTVTVTDAYNCTKTASVSVSESPTLLDVSAIGSVPVTCAGSGNGTASVTPSGGTAPYAYLWSDPAAQATAVAAGLAGGVYTVTVTDNYNCSKTATVNVSESSQNLVVTASNVVGVTCSFTSDGSATVSESGGTGPYVYTWSTPNGSGATASNLTMGVYTVTVSDAYGCSSTTSIDISPGGGGVLNADFTASVISGPNPLDVVFTNNSTGANAYNWTFGDGTTSTASSPSYTYNVKGLYTVTLMAMNAGCADTASVIIEVYESPVLCMPNIFTPNGDGTNDIFMSCGKGLKEFHCIVYNRWGEMIYEWFGEKGGWDGRTYSGLQASDGTYYYFVNATGEDNANYQKHGFINLVKN